MLKRTQLKSKWNLKKTQIKNISDNKKTRLKNKMSEIYVFDEVYKIHNWKCILTGLDVDKWNSSSYPHLLPKWWYPHHRLNINNIGLVYNDVAHSYIDQIVSNLIKERWRKEIEELMISWKLKELIILEYRKNN
jgi:hypothetical protein